MFGLHLTGANRKAEQVPKTSRVHPRLWSLLLGLVQFIEQDLGKQIAKAGCHCVYFCDMYIYIYMYIYLCVCVCVV